MSPKECDRLVILHEVADGLLSVSEGARRCRLDRRHFRRLLRRLEAEGDFAVIHHARGGRPPNAKSDALRAQVLARAQDPLYADFGPTLLSEHLARDPAIGFVHRQTLRRWLIEAGLWTPTRRGQRHRRWRERRAAWGELVLMDTSIHPWLEARSSEPIVLIAMIDDATSRLHARFFPHETGAANRTLLIDYLRQHGRMGALYTDRAGHFQAHFRATERREREQTAALTVIQRGLAALDIALILALSPQAKGRVERLFGTLQDRLIKELRVAGVSSLDAANRFLTTEFLPFWHQRFTVAPREPGDAHRALPAGVDLLHLFADTARRTIRHDFTFRYQRTYYQIERGDADPTMPTRTVTIEERLDGTTRFRWHNHWLTPTRLPGSPCQELVPKPAPPPGPRPLYGAAGKPIPPTHPWRRFPLNFGRGHQPQRRPSTTTATGEPPGPPATLPPGG